ncbi:hypothetical protein RF11_01482 [Thelohanellus kitauei]|uniref:Uncharacterized protein n=1 Tax=Thelohanellus kitauei TaxID=669202 RepID=A0A0C2MCU6_THEKT|nr:hypothetical protein RF11_01482 [Thelohanellus kitauei]
MFYATTKMERGAAFCTILYFVKKSFCFTSFVSNYFFSCLSLFYTSSIAVVSMFCHIIAYNVSIVQHENTFTAPQTYCFLFDFGTKVLGHLFFVKYATLPINITFRKSNRYLRVSLCQQVVFKH